MNTLGGNNAIMPVPRGVMSRIYSDRLRQNQMASQTGHASFTLFPPKPCAPSNPRTETPSTKGYDPQNQPSLIVHHPSSPEAGITTTKTVDWSNQLMVHAFRIESMTCHSDLLARQRREAPRLLPVDQLSRPLRLPPPPYTLDPFARHLRPSTCFRRPQGQPRVH